MSRNRAIAELVGWVLFLVCAVFFLLSSARSGDTYLVVGSALFLVACLVFIVPIVPQLRRGRGVHRDPSEDQ